VKVYFDSKFKLTYAVKTKNILNRIQFFKKKINSDEEDESDESICAVFVPQRKTFRYRPKFFNILNDSKFYDRFRLSKETAYQVLSMISEQIERKTNW